MDPFLPIFVQFMSVRKELQTEPHAQTRIF